MLERKNNKNGLQVILFYSYFHNVICRCPRNLKDMQHVDFLDRYLDIRNNIPVILFTTSIIKSIYNDFRSYTSSMLLYTCCHSILVVNLHLLSLFTCCHYTLVVTLHFLLFYTCCYSTLVVIIHLLLLYTCCHYTLVVIVHLLSLFTCCHYTLVVTLHFLSLYNCCHSTLVVILHLLSLCTCCHSTLFTQHLLMKLA